MTTATTGAASVIASTPRGRATPSGTGVPRAIGGRPGRGHAPARRRRRTRSRAPVCAPAGPPCHRGARGRPRRPGPRASRWAGILAGRAAEDVDARHLGVLRRRGAERQVEHGPQVVLELGGHGALHRPVARVVGPGRHLVHQQAPPDQKSSTAMTPTPPAISATFWPRARGGLEHVGLQAPRHQHLPADPADLGRLDRRPGGRRARGAAGHHDRQLGLQGQELLDHDPARHAGEDGLPPRTGRATGHTPLPS